MRKSKYTKDFLGPIVKRNISIAGVLRELGLKAAGGNHRYIQSRIRFNNLDISHFKGRGWSRGLTEDEHPSIAANVKRNSYSNKEVFTENSPLCGGHKILKRLLRDYCWEYKCLKCSISKWRGEDITLHVDHINGINNDNRLENLRILCPNCHQQTDTWGNKNATMEKR